MDALVNSSGRRKLSSSVLLDLTTKLSHGGSTGLSRLNQDWTGPYFLGAEGFQMGTLESRDRQAGGLCP